MFLLLLSIVWGYAVFEYGGVVRWNRMVYLLSLGVVALAYWAASRRRAAPRLTGALSAAMLLLPTYVAVQLVPLPVAVIQMLSPGRAELVRAFNAVAPEERFATLSIVPSATMNQFLLVCGYTLVFLVVRDIGRHSSGRSWVLAAPIIAIGVLEAALGLTQAFTAQGAGEASGTFENRDHYAALLAMALPFAVMYPVAIWRRVDTRHDFPLAPAVKMCVFFGLSAVILLGIIYSLSRMGFIATLFSLLVMGMVAWFGGGTKGMVSIGLLGAGLLACLIFLPPDQLIERFSPLASVEGITTDDRLLLWGESLGAFRAFPVLGCGLGCFESVFPRYKVTFPLLRDGYAHNDYLQFLIELGMVGFAIGVVLFGCIVRKALRVVSAKHEPGPWSLAIACMGAFAAIRMHSFVDFNLYTPADAMLLAWIAGICVSLDAAPVR